MTTPLAFLPDTVQSGVPLSNYTSLRIGGPADRLVVVDTARALAATVVELRHHGTPFLVFGAGTNLLVDDAGTRNLVLINRAADVLEVDGERIRAASGVPLSDVVEAANAHALTGLEFAAGIPGTFGGGLVGNAGAWGKSLGDVVLEAEVVTREGKHLVLPAADCGFAYRHSALREQGAVLISATLSLSAGEREAGRARIDEILAARAERHPGHDTPTAGSYFRNVMPTSAAERRTAAGYYLERVGAKSLRVGDAAVFEKHANIVVNAGAATAGEVLALTAELRARVLAQYNIALEPEVRYIRPHDAH